MWLGPILGYRVKSGLVISLTVRLETYHALWYLTVEGFPEHYQRNQRR